MRLTPNGNSEHYNGGEIGRYGRDISGKMLAFCWYHDGIKNDAKWAMDVDAEWLISISTDILLVADANNGLYSIDRNEFAENTEMIDGREQCVAKEGDDFVTYIGDPDDHLRGNLWITAANGHGGYHKDKNH